MKDKERIAALEAELARLKEEERIWRLEQQIREIQERMRRPYGRGPFWMYIPPWLPSHYSNGTWGLRATSTQRDGMSQLMAEGAAS